MAVIGFRCWPDGFAYVVLDGTQAAPTVVAKARLKFPTDTPWSHSLAWARRQLEEILRQFPSSAAAVKTQEPAAQHKSLPRAEVEGVIKEAVFSFSAVECTTRMKIQLRAAIRDFKEPARYIERALEPRGLAELQHANFEEAGLAALSMLPQ
jgi:hypothetical protein